MKSPAPSSSSPATARILVRGVNWLGDAVMTTPALLRLRERFPAAHIALLTPAKLRDLWQQHPAINATLTFEPGEGAFAVGRRLRAGQFDLAVVLPNSPRSALEVWLARIPRRLGLARPWRNWFLTNAVPPRPGIVEMRKRSVSEIRQRIASTDAAGPRSRPAITAAGHHLHQYLHITAALGADAAPLPPQLAVADAEVQEAGRKFELDQFGSAPLFLGLNPGAEYGPAKRWPALRFVAAADEIRQHTNCVWLLFGGPSDRPVADEIIAATRAILGREPAMLNLAGRTSLRELMALLKLCRVLLTNDTGPMHVAAALGTPVVVPFGSTSPELTGPGLPGDPRHHLLKSAAACAPCFLRECPIDFRCMSDISTERVTAGVMQALNR